MATYKSPYSGKQVDTAVKNTSSLNFENGVLKVSSDIQLTEMGDENNSVATKAYVDEHAGGEQIPEKLTLAYNLVTNQYQQTMPGIKFGEEQNYNGYIRRQLQNNSDSQAITDEATIKDYLYFMTGVSAIPTYDTSTNKTCFLFLTSNETCWKLQYESSGLWAYKVNNFPFATKSYVDEYGSTINNLNTAVNQMQSDFQTQIDNKLGLSGGLIDGPLYLDSISPENHVATKKYVDEASVAGLPPAPDEDGDWVYVCHAVKAKYVNVASTANVIETTLSQGAFNCVIELPFETSDVTGDIWFTVENGAIMTPTSETVDITISGTRITQTSGPTISSLNYNLIDNKISITGDFPYRLGTTNYRLTGGITIQDLKAYQNGSKVYEWTLFKQVV